MHFEVMNRKLFIVYHLFSVNNKINMLTNARAQYILFMGKCLYYYFLRRDKPVTK